MNTFIILLSLCAIALASNPQSLQNFQTMVPQQCLDNCEQEKECLQREMTRLEVDIDFEDVKSCFDDCPANITRLRRNTGRSEAVKEFYECVKGEVASTIDDCVDEKIAFEIAERPEMNIAARKWKESKGKIKFQQIVDFSRRCGTTVSDCVRDELGTWHQNINQLDKLFESAKKLCPQNKTEECNLQQRQVDFAYCECRQAHRTEIEQAKTDCTTEENRAHVRNIKLREPKCASAGPAAPATPAKRFRRHHKY